MTTADYLKALKRLNLTPSGQATAQAFGLTVRQCQRIAAGAADVSGPLAKLIGMYLKHGIPAK